jgi:hypothetical protein
MSLRFIDDAKSIPKATVERRDRHIAGPPRRGVGSLCPLCPWEAGWSWKPIFRARRLNKGVYISENTAAVIAVIVYMFHQVIVAAPAV